MWKSPEIDAEDEGLFLAGERVSPGSYRLVGSSGRQVVLDKDDVLPATLDGRVACYMKVDNTWEQIAGTAHV